MTKLDYLVDNVIDGLKNRHYFLTAYPLHLFLQVHFDTNVHDLRKFTGETKTDHEIYTFLKRYYEVEENGEIQYFSHLFELEELIGRDFAAMLLLDAGINSPVTELNQLTNSQYVKFLTYMKENKKDFVD